ncbi:MAG: FtsQ-type POTRA domain-containing protein [Patescibacteria group bacterium]
MYKTRRMDQQRSSRGFVITLVVAFALIGTAWFLFASGFFDISTIEIEGIQMLDRGEVTREVDSALEHDSWKPWKKNNLLMLDTERLKNTLKDRLFVANVTVDKSYPNILRLLIEERQRSVILKSNDQYVHVDATGVVTGYVEGENLASAQNIVAARSLSDLSTLPVIIMNTADPLAPGFQIAEPEQVRRWLDTFNTVLNEGIKIRFMKIETPEASLGRFVSDHGYDIYFDLKQPLEGQIATYSAYVKTQPDLGAINYYIDVRIPGRIFVK